VLFGSLDGEVVLLSSVSCWAKQRTECERVPSAFLLNSTCTPLHIYTSK